MFLSLCVNPKNQGSFQIQPVSEQRFPESYKKRPRLYRKLERGQWRESTRGSVDMAVSTGGSKQVWLVERYAQYNVSSEISMSQSTQEQVGEGNNWQVSW